MQAYEVSQWRAGEQCDARRRDGDEDEGEDKGEGDEEGPRTRDGATREAE